MSKQNKAQLPSLRLRLVALCMGAILVMLIISVSVLLLLLTNVMGAYVKNNIEFTLKETSNNLAVKTSMLEDMLLRLRSDDVLITALGGEGLVAEMHERSATSEALRDNADLYANRNIDTLSEPFVDMVYLFDANGVFNRAAYTDYLLSRQEQIDKEYSALCNEFLKQGTDVSVTTSATHINIIYTLYSEWMEPLGTVIFALNKSAVSQLMEGTSVYSGAFWTLFDKHSTPVMQSENTSLTKSDEVAVSTMRKDSVNEYDANGVRYLMYTQVMSMGLRCCIGVPQNQLSVLLLDAVLPYLFLTVSLLMVIAALMFWQVMRLTKPLAVIAGNLQQVADKHFDVKLPAYNCQEYETIGTTFNSMTQTINHLINDVYEKKLMAMGSEIQMLQSQINPHFMYNVLHTIALKSKMDGDEEVYKMISNFAGLTRARLSHKGNDKISIEQELQYVRFYLELQQVRFEDKLQYHICLQNDELLHMLIPRLTLEMIVENAVVHGIEPKDGPGNVYIDISRDKNGVLILIEDDGVGFAGQDGEVRLPLPEKETESHVNNHIALNNAYKLMKYFYGEEYGITIRSRRNVGTVVQILIPAEEVQTDDKNNDCR